MGANKALLLFHGRPLIERVIDRLNPIADEVLVTCNSQEPLSSLRWPVFMDRKEGRGALEGLFTALSVSRGQYVAVAACDLPFASRKLMAHQYAVIQSGGMDVVVPGTPKGLEPLHAVYRRQTCLPIVEQMLDEGHFRISTLFGQVRTCILNQDQINAVDPDPRIFFNVNTPDDFQRAVELAESD